LDGHSKGVNCVDYFTGGDRPYLITGSDDQTAKVWHLHIVMHLWALRTLLRSIDLNQVWDYQTKSCVQTLEGHAHNVTAVCFHPELPIIMTGSEDGTVRLWHSATYRYFEYTLWTCNT
jgi:coatomer subunit beta'